MCQIFLLFKSWCIFWPKTPHHCWQEYAWEKNHRKWGNIQPEKWRVEYRQAKIDGDGACVQLFLWGCWMMLSSHMLKVISASPCCLQQLLDNPPEPLSGKLLKAGINCPFCNSHVTSRVQICSYSSAGRRDTLQSPCRGKKSGFLQMWMLNLKGQLLEYIVFKF